MKLRSNKKVPYIRFYPKRKYIRKGPTNEEHDEQTPLNSPIPTRGSPPPPPRKRKRDDDEDEDRPPSKVRRSLNFSATFSQQ